MHRKWMAAALASVLIALPAEAHHSFAMFDMTKTVTATGTITEFRWTNPHSWLHIDLPGASGVEHWAIEMTSPNNLVKGGWRRSSLKPGDKATIQFHPLFSGKEGGSLARVTLADGSVLENK